MLAPGQPAPHSLPFAAADEADRYRRLLVETLLATFPKYLTPANLLVKALPPGNQNIVVVVRRSSPSGGRRRTRGAPAAEGPVFVVDLTALSLHDVHRRLRRSDPHFDCDS